MKLKTGSFISLAICAILLAALIVPGVAAGAGEQTAAEPTSAPVGSAGESTAAENAAPFGQTAALTEEPAGAVQTKNITTEKTKTAGASENEPASLLAKEPQPAPSAAPSAAPSPSPSQVPANASTDVPEASAETQEPQESLAVSPAPSLSPSPSGQENTPEKASEDPTASKETAVFEIDYRLREGFEAKLSFEKAFIEQGKPVGKNIPQTKTAGDYQPSVYYIANKQLSAEQLAKYVPKGDMMIEVYAQPVPKPTNTAKPSLEEIEKENPAVEEGDGEDPGYWEYPPGWAQSGQEYMNGNLLAAAELRLLDLDLDEYANGIKHTLGLAQDAGVLADEDNSLAVLAVYAVLNSQTEDFPAEISITGPNDANELRSLFWKMNAAFGKSAESGKMIKIERRTVRQAAGALGLSEEQTLAAESLVTAQNKAALADLCSSSILTKLTDEEFAEIVREIPAGVYGERRAVLIAALSLEGKVKYFWGGKSFYTNWDERWGQMRTVTSGGSKQSGTARPFGLDCSGFVSWAFISAGGDRQALSRIGNGTANQYKNSFAVDWNKAEPGDLVFYKNPSAPGKNHVGIVLSVNGDGTPQKIIHCSSSKNGVVVTDADGFKLLRRPYIYKS